MEWEARKRATLKLFDFWALLDVPLFRWLDLPTIQTVDNSFARNKKVSELWHKRVVFQSIAIAYRLKRMVRKVDKRAFAAPFNQVSTYFTALLY